jgi:hypothetical protein
MYAGPIGAIVRTYQKLENGKWKNCTRRILVAKISELA